MNQATTSLADLPELIGFFSYSREDDEDGDNALSTLRTRIQNELRGQLGRSRATLRLWQDQEAISPGTLWAAEIDTAIRQSVFFIPIITPRVINSKYCGIELEKFIERERALKREDLIFPILYINLSELEDERARGSNPFLHAIAQRQYVDWREFRYDPNHVEVRRAIAEFCGKVVAILKRRLPIEVEAPMPPPAGTSADAPPAQVPPPIAAASPVADTPTLIREPVLASPIPAAIQDITTPPLAVARTEAPAATNAGSHVARLGPLRIALVWALIGGTGAVVSPWLLSELRGSGYHPAVERTIATLISALTLWLALCCGGLARGRAAQATASVMTAMVSISLLVSLSYQPNTPAYGLLYPLLALAYVLLAWFDVRLRRIGVWLALFGATACVTVLGCVGSKNSYLPPQLLLLMSILARVLAYGILGYWTGRAARE